MATTKTVVRATATPRRSTKLKSSSKTAPTTKPKARSGIVRPRYPKQPECKPKNTVIIPKPKIRTGITSQRATSGISFLDLSAEIRNKIYKHLLTSPDKVRVRDEKRGDFGNSAVKYDTKNHIFTAILSTCHEVHNEAAPMLYGSNIFSMFSGMPFMVFVVQIGANVEFLRHICIENVATKTFVEQGLLFLKRAKMLKTLGFSRAARTSFKVEEAADLLEPMMRGLAKGGHGSVVDIFQCSPAKAKVEAKLVKETAEAAGFQRDVKALLVKRLA